MAFSIDKAKMNNFMTIIKKKYKAGSKIPFRELLDFLYSNRMNPKNSDPLEDELYNLGYTINYNESKVDKLLGLVEQYNARPSELSDEPDIQDDNIAVILNYPASIGLEFNLTDNFLSVKDKFSVSIEGTIEIDEGEIYIEFDPSSIKILDFDAKEYNVSENDRKKLVALINSNSKLKPYITNLVRSKQYSEQRNDPSSPNTSDDDNRISHISTNEYPGTAAERTTGQGLNNMRFRGEL